MHAANRGAALLVMLLFVVLALGTGLVSSLSGIAQNTRHQQKTSESLAQAKRAVIAWSMLQGDSGAGTCTEPGTGTCPATGVATCTTSCIYPRPGSLPCPDTNFFGSNASGYATGSCSASGETSIGRLPWKTLGIEMLRDAYGEPLWYAVSDRFRRPGLTNAAINSDTVGTLKLYAPDGTTLLSPGGEELAAVIFSPGPPLAGQERMAAPDDPASFLDSDAGLSNRNAAGPFVQGTVRDAAGNTVINDQITGISAKELIASLEKRGLREAENALAAYAVANGGKYPNPASGNCNALIANVSAPGVCASDSTTCIGRLPEDALAGLAAHWFLANGWGRTTVYSVNKSDAIDSTGANCTTSLNVDGESRRYILIAPGTAKAAQNRPSPHLTDYLDDTVNSDAWSGNPDFTSPGAGSNDQLRSAP